MKIKSKDNKSRQILMNFYRFLSFVSILAIVFMPLGDLAYKYLPEPIAEQVAQFIPETPTASAHTDDVFVLITVASDSAMSSWTVPADWNSASNSIEVIGGGGGGGDGLNTGAGGGGGGGYSRINNLTLTPGAAVLFGVGASGSGGGTTAKGGDGGHTWFNMSTFAGCTDNTICVKAEGGAGGEGKNAVNGVGGLGGNFGTMASAVGTTTYAGGNGGTGCNTGDGGGGGGGAGGPAGTGGVGEDGDGDASPGVGGGGGGNGGGSAAEARSCSGSGTIVDGGNGGNGAGGSGAGTGGQANPSDGLGGNLGGGGGGSVEGGTGGKGGDGTEASWWVVASGSSGGGGGGGGDLGEGADGGSFGGGGGGGENNASGDFGNGEDGVIAIRYTPRAVQSHFQWFNNSYALDSMDNLASISAEDIKASGSEALSINSTYRLRIQIVNQKNYSKPSFTNNKFRLEMARAGTSCDSLSSGWDWRTVPAAADVGPASHAFEITTSSQITPDGASTSVSLLSATGAAANATFTSGFAMDVRATTGFQTIPDNQYTEIEWALKPNSNANTSADYCFRAGWITDASTIPDTRASMTYSKIASASVQAAAATPTFTQNDYEWFNNDSSSVQPGSSMTNSVENTQAAIDLGILPRLRMNVTIGTATMTAGSQQFDLQYASFSNGPWREVGVAGAKWSFANNTPSDGDAIITTLVASSEQGSRATYEENNPTVVNPLAAVVGDDVEWDWALNSGSTEPGVIYYFRMVQSDDTVFGGYNRYPEMRIKGDEKKQGGGGIEPSVGGTSGGGGIQSGGGQGAGGSGGSVDGGSGGGAAQGGGGQGGGGGGGSPVMFDWGWLNGSLLNSLWRWLIGN